jgi:hypothetical protein
MADNVLIQCINKRDRQSPHERISHVGGSSNGVWKLAVEEAIVGIETGRWRFYTNVNGQAVWVIVAVNEGRKYLKTENDGLHPNNLLSLPECP